jgi:heat shock protein HtpX
MNKTKTLVFLATLTALMAWAGYALAGNSGFVVAVLIAGLMNFGAYWFSDKIILKMYNARETNESITPELFGIAHDLSLRAGVPMPRLYVISEDAPNAFATGRNPQNAAVAVTSGLLRLLNREELTAVIAHELGHVKNRDTLITPIAATIAGTVSILADIAMWSTLFGGRSDDEEGAHPFAGILGIIIAPFAAMIIQLAISRSREYLADESGARYSGDPLSLARALSKIEASGRKIPMESGSPATASLFIINPFHSRGLARLFSTHPSTQERIQRLEQMAQKNSFICLVEVEEK